jgi:prolyl-tRNA editing enzyme YbaK/EbsC (Cys-tRNA(Pro) deacylase)
VTDTLPRIREILEGSAFDFEVWACDESLTDTMAFCEHYGASLENSANAILIKSKTGEEKFALCVIPAQARLDVNRTARKKLGARKVSFASVQETLDVTRMEIGGVTPLGLPRGLKVWVDSGLMDLDYVILGGGNKTSKIKVSPKILKSVPGVEIVSELAN